MDVHIYTKFFRCGIKRNGGQNTRNYYAGYLQLFKTFSQRVFFKKCCQHHGPHFLFWKVNLGSWIMWYTSETEANLLFTFPFWIDKIDQNTCFAELLSAKWLFGFYCLIIVSFSLQVLKNKHLNCLSFLDISRDPRAKIYLSMEKIWTKLLSAPCIEKVILSILCHVWNMFIHLWHGHCRRGISRMRIWWKSNPLLKIALFHPCYFLRA